FLFRAFHALPPLSNSRGVPTGAVYGLCQMLLRIEREWRPTHLCVIYDAPGPTFRDDIFAAYKANRPPMPTELVAQIGLSHRVVEAFGLPVLSLPGVEADDTIATLARQAVAAGLRVVICSSDKDLMQLCSDRIQLLDTMKNKLLGPAEVQEKFGVPPDRLGDLLTLMGDSVDNVPGVEGIGPKTAADLISQYGSLDGVLEHVAEIKGKKGQAIASSREAIEISRKLIRLREDVVLGRDVRDLARAEPDRARLAELFGELEFTRLLAQMDGARAASQAPKPEPAAGSGAGSESGHRLPGPPAGTSGPPATQPTPRASRALSPATGSAAAPEITALPLPPEIILDRAGLDGLCAAIRSAQAFGVAVLSEGAPVPRAALVGLAFALPSGGRFYLPVGHRLLGAPPMLSATEALAALGPLLASLEIRKYAHDGKVLDVLLRVRGVTLAGLAGDAMLAAYLLDAGRAPYDLPDLAAAEGAGEVPARTVWLGSGRSARPAGEVPVEEVSRPLCDEAWAALILACRQERAMEPLGLTKIYREVELPLVPVLARIECWGIRLDCDLLRQLGNEVARTITTLEHEIHEAVGTPFNISSPKQLAEVLFGKLGLPVVRKTKTGPSTDADVLEELATLHPIPAKVVEYRGLTKLKGTYIDALPALVDPRTGRLHTTFNQAVAVTGRLSSSDPNLQNIPIRSELGRRIRNAFVADPGYQIVSADYSQIELRVLAHFSQDPAFLDAFASGQDIHRRTAAEVFNVALDAVSGEQRRIAKAINFGLVFGQTDFGLAQTLRIARADAHAYIERYFQRYARVRQYMDEVVAEARRTGAVSTLLGRTRALPQLKSSRSQERNYAERMARNTPIQGSAADLLKLAMISVDREMLRFPEARLLLTVHDELVFEVKTHEVEAFSAWVKDAMESAYTLRVPLVVDVHAGPNWGAAH
ncbi:MAG TPA: DNA polymerase I, partial [Polyangia bacterium]|nr:DNA polymerase I [Polyangia bacterium]